jgi:rare lipoprotein A
MTAAHRTLAFGSKVRVTHLRSGRNTIVTINDRGPFTGGRIIDLSAAAAEAVGIKGSGVGKVRIDVLSYGSNKRRR